MQELQNKIRDQCLAERSRWVLWLPVLLGLGVGTYFGLENEPSLWLPSALAVGGLFASLLLRRVSAVALLLLCVAIVAGGLALGAWRSHHVAEPVLTRDLYPQEITGIVAEITTRPDSTRFTLRNAHIPDLAAEETPKFVTVSLRQHASGDIVLGDKIRLRAGFFPPPKPVIPGGYAFNRHFFFKQIGATGYSPGYQQPEILEKAEESGGVSQFIARTRHNIARWLIEHMGKEEGAIAAALMVGESRAIPTEIYDAMRKAGLVHVLAISGMHLSLAAGIFFFSARLVLAAIPRFSARYDGKKLAALIALAGAFIYLMLAGAPISARRSFVMVALVLIAVMLSRNPTPMRSLCFAAVVILLIAPESLLNPGFQLSFSATIGILAYYEYWREKNTRAEPHEWNWQRRMRNFWGGIIITSAVATVTTTPYILHHFDELPLYSILANLLVMPLVSFWIMPMVVLVMVLMPLGIAGWVLPLLKLGLYLMHHMAAWVAVLPYAVLSLPPLPTFALVLVTLGGLWICLWQLKWRHWGWLPIAVGMASLWFYQPPDMIISGDGKKIAIRSGDNSAVMLRGQRSGFMQDGWLRFMQVEAFGLRRHAAEDVLRCDDLGCIYHLHDKQVAVIDHRAALAEDCATADLTLVPHWSAYHDAKHLCPDGMLFDRSWLRKAGGAVFWLDGNIRYRTVAETLGNRPWSGRD